MEKIKVLQRIAAIYAAGGNIIQYLRSLGNNAQNTTEDILISYDFQAGSYIKFAKENTTYIHNYTQSIAQFIDKLGSFDSILEVGVGEATTLSNVIDKLQHKPKHVLGFDIAWSRVKYAQQYAQSKGIEDAKLVVGDLFAPPIAADSVDIVYTSHSIEPNGGREKDALQALYRIAKQYVILLEPAYDLATVEAQARMKSHGYVTQLYSVAQDLGYKIIEYRLFDYIANPLNPTGIMVIEKTPSSTSTDRHLACPITGGILDYYPDKHTYFTADSLLAYPIIDGIPCLLPQNAIVATHFLN